MIVWRHSKGPESHSGRLALWFCLAKVKDCVILHKGRVLCNLCHNDCAGEKGQKEKQLIAANLCAADKGQDAASPSTIEHEQQPSIVVTAEMARAGRQHSKICHRTSSYASGTPGEGSEWRLQSACQKPGYIGVHAVADCICDLSLVHGGRCV